MTDALAQQQQGGSELVMPVSGEQMVAALNGYRAIQKALDESMPDQIMQLDGKAFRKKGYWRAIALAFKLSVEPTDERREVSGTFKDGRPNFGYVVTYKASHSSGREAYGDGACFAVEKARRFKCPHPEREGSTRSLHFPHNTCPSFDPDFQWHALPGDATEHNVRGHAHTRAFNRAVSNLVGFGEVSAEEVEREEGGHAAATSTSAPASSAPAPVVDATGNTKVKSQPQITRGKNKQGDWALYVIKFEDGREATTFSDTIGQHAANAFAHGALVHPVIVEGENKGKKTHTLKEFGPLQKAPEVHQDEPVSGPEKLLTVRETKTDLGPRWVIQTDKRQVIAIDEVLATQALEARKQGIGLIPVFEVVALVKGGSFNKLLNWQHADAPVESVAEGGK